LAHLLGPQEMDELQKRLQHLLASTRFPEPDSERTNLPWPLI
jgi:hypothetical protein